MNREPRRCRGCRQLLGATHKPGCEVAKGRHAVAYRDSLPPGKEEPGRLFPLPKVDP